MDFWIRVELCRRYGLNRLEEELRGWKSVLQEPVRESELSEPVSKPLSEPELPGPVSEPVLEPELSKPAPEPELSEFIKITDFSSPVMVQMSDFRINATHIVKLIGRSKHVVMALRNGLSSETYKILRGSKWHQGTYVDFDIGIELC